jgi:hypothetical protein
MPHYCALLHLDHQQRVGFAIFTLYSLQLLLGIFIHTVRTPGLFIAHCASQNYLHVAFGLTMLAMAGYQVRTLSRRLSLKLNGGPILFDGRGIGPLRTLYPMAIFDG